MQDKKDVVWWRPLITNKRVELSTHNFAMRLNHFKPQPKDVSFE